MSKVLARLIFIAAVLLAADDTSAVCRKTLPFSEAENVWGRIFLAPEAPVVGSSSPCNDEPYGVALITGDESDHFVGAYLWRDGTYGTRSRGLEWSFQIPSQANLDALSHVGAMVAWEEPDPNDHDSGYGRFGAAIFRDVLYVEYMVTGDSGCPAMGEGNLFAPVAIRGGLRSGVWYRSITEVRRVGARIFVGISLYQIVGSNWVRRVARTSLRFPQSCYPRWYGLDRVGFLTAHQGLRESVAMYIDDVRVRSR